MKRVLAATLAAAAGAATIALAVPGVASADGPDCSQAARTAAHQDAKPKVQALLAAHPDLQAEFTKIKGLPKDQRKAEWTTYKQAHPDQAQALRDARSAVITFRQNCHK
ncbi:hemophore-related protein [Nocardia sp. NPDC059240]|uniref:hemophore-related protein n=1 Tax=Nocardia sp. NPDC059240 TaxID=3346786 RepID=UPI0036C8FB43